VQKKQLCAFSTISLILLIAACARKSAGYLLFLLIHNFA